VGERLPAAAGQFAEPLRSHLSSEMEIKSVINGRQKSFRLADLCAAALAALQLR
jgi:hypothetical protein